MEHSQNFSGPLPQPQLLLKITALTKMKAGIPVNAHTITAADGTIVPVPEEYVCPLTLDVMQEPYLSREGHNYEREAIMKWVANYGSSPLTREKLMPVHLSRNFSLEMKIRLFLMQNGVVTAGKDKSAPAQETMTLHSLTSAAMTEPRPRATVQEPVSEEHLAARRQQIADMIGSAMSELDDF